MPYKKKQSLLEAVKPIKPKKIKKAKPLAVEKPAKMAKPVNASMPAKSTPMRQTNTIDTIPDFIQTIPKQPALAKPVRRSHRAASIVLLIISILIVLGGVAATAFYSYNIYQDEMAVKQAAVLDAVPRITVPPNHFQKMSYEHTFLKNMRAIKVTPKVDIYKDENATKEQIAAEVDKLIENITTLGFNAIILDTKLDSKVVFTSTVYEATPVDLLALIVEKAKPANISVLTVLHATGVNTAGGEPAANYLSPQSKGTLYKGAQELAGSYQLDSIMLDSYYIQNDPTAYAQYISYGGIGSYDDWLYKNAEITIDKTSDAISIAANSMPMGIVINDVWADENAKEGGSKTKSDFSALMDGFTDTKGLIESKKVDYACVDIATSTDNKDQSFTTITKWWNEVCTTSSTPLYVIHHAENANSTKLTGWNGTGQLAEQVIVALKNPMFQGSAFTGIDSMMKDMKSSTGILLDYYAGEYSEKDVLQGIDMTSPTKHSFTTYEENIQFRGKYDPHQEVFINGEKVVPTERGGFSVWVPLKVGKNQVTLKHKGETVTYNIERKVIIFKTVSPTKEMHVSGSSTIEFNVMAYNGSKITATINGQTITLTEGGGGDENVVDSAYVNYQGSYTVPKAGAKEQDIGSITFRGSYQGYNETKGGSHVIVDKLPDEVDPDTATGLSFPHAVVTQRYANTYPPGTASGYPQAILYQLPQGTQDIVESVNGEFLNLRSGKVIRAASASVSDMLFEGNNTISQFSAGVEGNDTVIRATMGWKAPFSIDLSPYPNEPPPSKGYQFAANTVTILLDYSTTMDKDNASVDVSSSSVFSGITYERIFNENKRIYQYKITLPLRQAGKYYGAHATYEDNTLVIKFNQPPPQGTLSGLKIAVDGGHGGKETGTMAGSDVIEKDINYSIALKVKAELEALGATVVMMRNDDETITVEQRVDRAHANGVDMYLACHHNSAAPNPSPNGVETYFNAPFSQPLASAIQAQLGQILADRGAKSSTGKYNFVVTRERQYPAVLIEYGFLSNPTEEQKIMNPDHQQAMAKATAQGVLNYFN